MDYPSSRVSNPLKTVLGNKYNMNTCDIQFDRRTNLKTIILANNQDIDSPDIL